MISPRRTRLVRVVDLHAFRDVVSALCTSGDLFAIRSRLVVVPSRGAGRQLRRSFENRASAVHPAPRASNAAPQLDLFTPQDDARAIVVPDVVTRDQMLARFHARLAVPPRRLTPYEREAMVRAAAREASAETAAPFRIRPGLVAEMLRFYDQLRNQGRNLDRFEELAGDALGRDAEFDRGAERLLQQTRFFAATFRSYMRRVRESAACDDHALRQQLLDDPAPDPIREVVVTVADWIADPAGLFLADFDLLTRIPALESIDIVATETLLASGFHQRIHEWLPGIEEVDLPFGRPEPVRPRLEVLAGSDRLYSVFRDREEELIAAARRIKADRRAGIVIPLDRQAVVFKRPLPYLYLGQTVFAEAGIPLQVSDALPLAAEPFAAALDLVLACGATNCARDALVSLLRSPHFDFGVTGPSIAALDRALSSARYLGDPDRLRTFQADWTDARTGSDQSSARSALDVAVEIADRLAPLGEAGTVSSLLTALRRFLLDYMAGIDERAGEPATRLLRGRAAVMGVLAGLGEAHASHDDPVMNAEELAALVRRWIEEETFVPASASDGVQLLDDQAARFGDFERITVVGVVEGEWPERPRRNIFYPPGLLTSLGWPSERDRRGAAEARFVELLASASDRVRVSVFELDDESLVEPSSLLDALRQVRLSTRPEEPVAAARVFLDEAISMEPPLVDALDVDAQPWAVLRLARTAAEDDAFHGRSVATPARTWSVSALELYLACPFKFYCQHVLRLKEEPEDEEVMDPRREGEFVHSVFEAFFSVWREAVTPANLDAARAAFAAVVDERLAALPEAEGALQRTRLLGSPAAAGLGEAVLRMEAERPVVVVDRLLEHPLEGEFEFAGADGPRRLAIRAKADRIDLLEDGTFRLIDYKLGRPPSRSRALQLAVYSICAEQRLTAEQLHGRTWSLGEAVYIAFGGPRRVVPLFSSTADRATTFDEAQTRLLNVFDAIGRGEFPPTPEDVRLCTFCDYAAVCRKDYVGTV